MESTKKNVIIIMMILFITVENIYAPDSDDDDVLKERLYYKQRLLNGDITEHELPYSIKQYFDSESYGYGNTSTDSYGYGNTDNYGYGNTSTDSYDYGNPSTDSYDYGNPSTDSYDYGNYDPGNPRTGNYETGNDYTENDYTENQYNNGNNKNRQKKKKKRSTKQYNESPPNEVEENLERVFNPVTYTWQETHCLRLNFDIQNYFTYEYGPKLLTAPSKTVSIIGDGNCYYRALSYWITGSQEYHQQLREKVVQVIENNSLFENYFDGNHKALNYVRSNSIKDNGEWGSDNEIYAAAILLDTTIFVYSANEDHWQMFHKGMDFSVSSMPVNEECIYLTFTGGNHYDVVIDVTDSN